MSTGNSGVWRIAIATKGTDSAARRNHSRITYEHVDRRADKDDERDGAVSRLTIFAAAGAGPGRTAGLCGRDRLATASPFRHDLPRCVHPGGQRCGSGVSRRAARARLRAT